jgi:ABC-type nitrate/sulfonate/bicarbonate transport system substrate-binding protein
MFKKIYCLIGLILVLISSVITACNSSAAAQPPAQVSVRLKWLHQTQFAGMYVAEKEGYYTAENLSVKLDPVDLTKNVTYENVLAGDNDIGIGAPEEIIIARSEGKPLQAIAVIFRLNPFVYLASGESGVKTPQDFEGKTVVVSPGQGTILYTAMMANLGIDRSKINEIPSQSFTDIKECWKVAAACPDYASNALVKAQQEGLDFTAIWPSDYGVPFYSDVIFATDEFIEKNPDVAQRFVRATLKGWQKALEDPELATKDTLAFDSNLDHAVQLAGLNASTPLVDTGEDYIGYMKPEVWQQMHDILLEQGFIKAPLDVKSVYTNEFVEKAQR